MDKKNIFLISLGSLFIIFLVYAYISSFNLSSLATDSGFDVSYDSGGGSSWSSSSDWGSSSSDGDGDGDIFGIGENIIMGGIAIFTIFGIFNISKKKKILLSIGIGILVVLRMFVFLIVLVSVIGTIIVLPIVLIKESINNKKKNKEQKLDLNVKEEDKPILDEGYQIFYDVQMAWMNFDYNALRELVTDELYNMYYNQLQTLSLKGQKNVMSDFELLGYKLNSAFNHTNGTKSVNMSLNVKFYDYIVDQNGKKVRGNNRKKVNMTYSLSFVSKTNAITECPNCKAPLSSGATVCEHCKTHIQSTRGKMKLSNKRVISQK